MLSVTGRQFQAPSSALITAWWLGMRPAKRLWSGIVGGLLGSTIAQYLGRFKYWLVFFATALSTPLFAFGLSIYVRGCEGSLSFFSGSTFLMIMLSIGFGLAATALVFLGSLNAPENSGKGKDR